MTKAEVSSDIQCYIDDAIAKARVVNGVPAEAAPLPIRQIGIVGAGTMGCGIGMSFATAGLPVTIVDTSLDALNRGFDGLRATYARSAARGRFPIADIEQRMSRLTGALDVNTLAGCDLVIEAVYEDMELKKSVFRQLDAVIRPGAILASNTSGLNLNEIAAVTSRPQWVIGLHFFSPAHVMKLIEVVRGAKTSATVLGSAMLLAAQLDKIAVAVGVCPGFVGNRMLYPRQLRAQDLLTCGVMPWDIDRVLKDFGFKMGPFEMADLAGLDIGWTKGATTSDRLRDALCELGRRGQKTDAGYYDYGGDRTHVPSPVVEALIRETREVRSSATPPSDEEILESCLFPLVNEGIRILEECIAQRPSDIDVVWLFGFGWPQRTGGPMRWADHIGLERILGYADRISKSNPQYAAAPLLRRLVAEGRSLSDINESASHLTRGG